MNFNVILAILILTKNCKLYSQQCYSPEQARKKSHDIQFYSEQIGA